MHALWRSNLSMVWPICTPNLWAIGSDVPSCRCIICPTSPRRTDPFELSTHAYQLLHGRHACTSKDPISVWFDPSADRVWLKRSELPLHNYVFAHAPGEHIPMHKATTTDDCVLNMHSLLTIQYRCVMIHLLTIAKLKSIRLWRSELPLRIVRPPSCAWEYNLMVGAARTRPPVVIALRPCLGYIFLQFGGYLAEVFDLLLHQFRRPADWE